VAHRKERFEKSVRANGWMSSGVAVERSVRALTRRLMRWLRYRGTDVFNDTGSKNVPSGKSVCLNANLTTFCFMSC